MNIISKDNLLSSGIKYVLQSFCYSSLFIGYQTKSINHGTNQTRSIEANTKRMYFRYQS